MIFDRNIKQRVRHWLRERLHAMQLKMDAVAAGQYLGQPILYDPSTVIGGLLLSSGEFERKEMELCREYISETGVVIDIGANIGLHSIYFSKLAKNGCVIALEPSLATFGVMVKNLANIGNVLPINLAASSQGGMADFFHASDNAYSSLIDTKRKEIVSVRKVPCMTVDDLVSGLRLEAVDFVKIDVEGLEFAVLQGMAAVIAKFRPVIFCEIYRGKSSNPRPDETVRFLMDKGYRALVVRQGKLTDYEKHEDAFFNYLFLPKV